jgi:hypothetical protein
MMLMVMMVMVMILMVVVALVVLAMVVMLLREWFWLQLCHILLETSKMKQ